MFELSPALFNGLTSGDPVGRCVISIDEFGNSIRGEIRHIVEDDVQGFAELSLKRLQKPDRYLALERVSYFGHKRLSILG